MNQDIKDRIEDIRANILLEQPFYGTILSHIPLVEDESCGTAATDGRRIIYSPGFVASLNGKELKFLLLHELLHILLMHFSRKKGRDPVIWNIATDYVINWFSAIRMSMVRLRRRRLKRCLNSGNRSN